MLLILFIPNGFVNNSERPSGTIIRILAMTCPTARQHPKVEPIRLDYETCANLHNRIFQIAWSSTNKNTESWSLQTWWERFSPSEQIASRLNADLIEFLKRAYYHDNAPAFFYFLQPLTTCEHLLDDPWFEDRGKDRFINLHHATGFNCGDEMGLLYRYPDSLLLSFANMTL